MDYLGLKLCSTIVRTLLTSKMMVLVSILLDDKNFRHIFAILEYDDTNLYTYFNESNSLTPMKSYRDFCDTTNHILLPGMDLPTASFIRIRFRFLFLKDFIFAVCSEELLGLLHYRLVV